jgi:hypothetical protein
MRNFYKPYIKGYNNDRKHYENFPENPEDFDEWVKKSEALWKKKKVAIKHLSNNVSIEFY